MPQLPPMLEQGPGGWGVLLTGVAVTAKVSWSLFEKISALRHDGNGTAKVLARQYEEDGIRDILERLATLEEAHRTAERAFDRFLSSHADLREQTFTAIAELRSGHRP